MAETTLSQRQREETRKRILKIIHFPLTQKEISKITGIFESGLHEQFNDRTLTKFKEFKNKFIKKRNKFYIHINPNLKFDLFKLLIPKYFLAWAVRKSKENKNLIREFEKEFMQGKKLPEKWHTYFVVKEFENSRRQGLAHMKRNGKKFKLIRPELE